MADSTSVIANAVSAARESGAMPAAEVDTSVDTAPVSDAGGDSDDTSVQDGSSDATGTADATATDTTTTAKAEGQPAGTPDKKKPGPKTVALDEDVETELKKVLGSDNRIPHKDVRRIVQTKLSTSEKAWLGEMGKALGVSHEGVDKSGFLARVVEHVKDLPALRARAHEWNTLDPVIRTQPENYLQVLAELFPEAGYQRFLEAAKGGKIPAGRIDKDLPTAEEDPEPEPDHDLGNGNMTFSKGGFAKWKEWSRRDVLRGILPGLNEKIKPFEDARTTAQQAEASDRARRADLTSALQTVSTWPGFEENKTEIAHLAKTDPEISKIRSLSHRVFTAYAKHMSAKLVQDRQAMREEILKELQATPASTSATSTVKAKDTAPLHGVDLIRAKVREAQASGSLPKG